MHVGPSISAPSFVPLPIYLCFTYFHEEFAVALITDI